MGCCANSEGRNYGYVAYNQGTDTVEVCAQTCKSVYSSDEAFVGINFHPDWFGSPNCNCMLDTDGNGEITQVDDIGCPEEFCYSLKVRLNRQR